jgi:hypothetical protein
LPYQTLSLTQLGRDKLTAFSLPAGSHIPFSYKVKNYYVPAGIKDMYQSSGCKTFKAVSFQVIVFFVWP